MQFRNALLVQTAFIGDVILTTPMIAAFKRFLPDCRLTVMVKPEAESLLKANPSVDRILVIDKKKLHRGIRGMLQMVREIRRANFDLLISPHQSHRTSLLALFSGIRTRYGYKSAGFSRAAYTHRLERPGSLPEIRRLLEFLKSIHGQNQSSVSEIPVLFESENSKKEAAALLESLGVNKPALIAPSSVWPTKRWTPWGFAELIIRITETYHCPILLVGSPEDYSIGNDVMNLIKEIRPDWSEIKVHNICGKTSLMGLYSIMCRSLFLISNDSAPVHFACAAGIPVVSIFGPTVPSLGYAPLAPRTIVAQKDGLQCRPCGTHGARICPLRHFHCMKKLTAPEVFQALQKVTR